MIAALVSLAGLALSGSAAAQVPYVRTPERVVTAMLEAANVTAKDTVYDLGCGDGRIVIAAAQRYGARGVGIDNDPERIREATENARSAGVLDRVRFVEQSFFDSDLSQASVVTLYLVPHINLQLRPKLLKELAPGTRIVSHQYDMGDWKPQRVVRIGPRRLYVWVVPPRA